MRRGGNAAETAKLNGWTVGTVVRGHEEWADGLGVWDTWRITAIGEDTVLVRTIRRDFTGVDREPDLAPVAHPERGDSVTARPTNLIALQREVTEERARPVGLSGWCSQRGRPNHAGCRMPTTCACECHGGVE